MPINSETQLWANLTVHTCTGTVTVDQVIQTIRSFYEGRPTKNALWDCTRTSLEHLSPLQIRQTVFEVSVYNEVGLADARIDGRTALVVASPADHALGLLAITLGELEELPFVGDVFYTLEDAQHWLGKTVDIDSPSSQRKIIPQD